MDLSLHDQVRGRPEENLAHLLDAVNFEDSAAASDVEESAARNNLSLLLKAELVLELANQQLQHLGCLRGIRRRRRNALPYYDEESRHYGLAPCRSERVHQYYRRA